MKAGLFFILLLIVIFIVFFSNKQNTLHSFKVNPNSNFQNKLKIEPQRLYVRQKLIQYDDKLTTAPQASTSDPVRNNQTITSSDENGGEIEINFESKEYVLDKIKSKSSFTPGEEIKNLQVVNFLNNESSLFSGNFIDGEIVKISLNWISDEGDLSPNSCIKIQNINAFTNEASSIKMYDDQAGYALVLIENKYFLRMAYTFSPKRILLGEIYIKKSNWEFLTKFNAFEDKTKTFGKCPY